MSGDPIVRFTGRDRRELDERLFDVVSQLDQGTELITDPEEKDQLARLNILAGTRAKAASRSAGPLA